MFVVLEIHSFLLSLPHLQLFDEVEAVRFANKAAAVAVSNLNYSPKLEEILIYFWRALIKGLGI